MRMKSVLALTALSAATFLASVAYAADAKQTTTQAASKALTQKTQTTATQAQIKAKKVAAAPVQAEKAAAATPAQAEKAASTSQTVHKGHKKHAQHKKHKKQHHHHHRHHHEHRPVFFVYEEIPCWNFLLGGSLGYAAQKETFITRYTRPQQTALPIVLSTQPLIVGAVNNAVLPIYYDHSEKITEQGVLFGLIAGWQWRYNRWLLGAEANVDFQGFEKARQYSYTEQATNVAGIVAPVNVAITGTMLYDRGDIYAVTGRAGYFVTPFFMPYVRLGAQLSRDEVQYQVFTNGAVTVGGAIVGPATNIFADYSSRKKDVYGVVAGVGAEFPTYIGASTIRFEYNFVKTESVIIDDHTFPVIGNHKFRYPESHIGKMAWIWNFM